MANTDRLAKIRETVELAKIANSIRKSKIQVAVLNTGLNNPAGFIYDGTYRTVSRFHRLGIVEFSNFKYRGKHLSRLTPKGRAVLTLLNSRINGKKADPVERTKHRRISSSGVDSIVGIQHQEIDTVDS